MEKDIKYLNYEVYHDGSLSHQGIIPDILSLSWLERDYALEGVWLWHTSPELVCLKLWNDHRSIEMYSDRTSPTWFQFAEEAGLSIPNPHIGR